MLLFDQNISYRILRLLETDFPGSLHVSRCGMPVPATDLEIWDFAAKHHLTIVTFDEDFSDVLSVRGGPPKIVWLRMGNPSTHDIA